MSDKENHMTIEEPAKKSRISTPAKLIAISAALILVGFGLCALGGINLEGPSSATTSIGTVAFLSGVGGFLVGVLWWLVAVISGSGK
jgi:hypothetical protein